MGKKISTEEFDRLFDEGCDITPYLDLKSMRRPNMETRKVNVDLPVWMIRQLDKEAERLSVPRQAVIKIMIDEGLERRGINPTSPGYLSERERERIKREAAEERVSRIVGEHLVDGASDQGGVQQDVKEG